MNLIRKYKCYKLTGKIDDKTKEIFNFVNENLLNLNKFEVGYYKGWIFYMNSNGKCILEYCLNNFDLFVKYYDFWEVLETKFNLNYYDIQDFIYYRVVKVYKLIIKSTNGYVVINTKMIEGDYEFK